MCSEHTRRIRNNISVIVKEWGESTVVDGGEQMHKNEVEQQSNGNKFVALFSGFTQHHG